MSDASKPTTSAAASAPASAAAAAAAPLPTDEDKAYFAAIDDAAKRHLENSKKLNERYIKLRREKYTLQIKLDALLKENKKTKDRGTKRKELDETAVALKEADDAVKTILRDRTTPLTCVTFGSESIPVFKAHIGDWHSAAEREEDATAEVHRAVKRMRKSVYPVLKAIDHPLSGIKDDYDLPRTHHNYISAQSVTETIQREAWKHAFDCTNKRADDDGSTSQKELCKLLTRIADKVHGQGGAPKGFNVAVPPSYNDEDSENEATDEDGSGGDDGE